VVALSHRRRGPSGFAAGRARPGPSRAVPLRTRLRGVGTAGSRRLRSTTYLRKWLVLGVLVGVIAGLGALVFYNALDLATHLFLRDLAGYQPPTPAGEGGLAGDSHFTRPWAIPLVVGLGGLLSGLIVFNFAPEAEGHGTDAAIAAVHDNPRGVRARAVVVKIVASAITIGAGGSGGREGPTAQISAGFGSFLSRALNLEPADGRILVSIGIGSGIGSIFGAPLGGALLSAEILYRDDIEVEAIVPGIIAAVVGYTVFSAVQGFAPLFGFASGSYQFLQPLALVWFGLIGILGGLVGLAYAKVFYATAGAFSGLRIARALKPAIGGVLVGLIALALPGVLGTGYGWIQKSLGHQLLGLPLWVVLALPAAKILTTSLSIGSGGSGGIFGPGMVIGAFTGASVWRLLEPIAPDIPHSPAPFVIVGMMACFGGISRAPLAVMLMTAEMTGSLAVLAPAMVAVGLSTLIVRRADDTIYRSQLASRADSPAHRLQAGMPLLGSIPVAQVMGAPRVIFDARNSATEAVAKLEREGLPGAPVVDENGVFIGTVNARALQETSLPVDPDSELESDHGPEVGRLADPTAPTVLGTDRLTTALEALMNAGTNWIPVVDEDRRVIGILSTSAVVRGYREGLAAGLRQVSHIAPHAISLDVRVAPGSPSAGHTLAELALPPGTIVMSLQRGSDQLLPRGDTVIESGDTLGVLTREVDLEHVRRTFSASPEDSPEQS